MTCTLFNRAINASIFSAGLLLSGPGFAANFGATMPAGEAVAIDVVAGNAAQYTGKPQLFSGRITEVCKMEGCWVMIEENGQAARVKVKDHAFTVPTDASGRAVVYGVLSEETLDAKTIVHLEHDSASSTPVAPHELQITATAINITP